MKTPLTRQETSEHLKHVPDWTHRAKTITRKFKFVGFVPAIAFVRLVAKCAEKLQHHPDIDIRFDQVTLTLTTHDAGGLTAKDFTMAGCADKTAAKFLEPAAPRT